jgi:hypothetical protein
MEPTELETLRRQVAGAVQKNAEQTTTVERRVDLLENNVSELRGFLSGIKKVANLIATGVGAIVAALTPGAFESIRKLAAPAPVQVIQAQPQPQPQVTVYVPQPDPIISPRDYQQRRQTPDNLPPRP